MYNSTECLLCYIALQHHFIPTLVTFYVLEVLMNGRGENRAEHPHRVRAPLTGPTPISLRPDLWALVPHSFTLSGSNRTDELFLPLYRYRPKAEYHVEWSLNKCVTCAFSLSGSSSSLGFSWPW